VWPDEPDMPSRVAPAKAAANSSAHTKYGFQQQSIGGRSRFRTCDLSLVRRVHSAARRRPAWPGVALTCRDNRWTWLNVCCRRAVHLSWSGHIAVSALMCPGSMRTQHVAGVSMDLRILPVMTRSLRRSGAVIFITDSGMLMGEVMQSSRPPAGSNGEGRITSLLWALHHRRWSCASG
jgi:hypothetical protein